MTSKSYFVGEETAEPVGHALDFSYLAGIFTHCQRKSERGAAPDSVSWNRKSDLIAEGRRRSGLNSNTVPCKVRCVATYGVTERIVTSSGI